MESRESKPFKPGTLLIAIICLLFIKLAYFFFSGSKSFKKTFKGKGDDIKLKVKPKKFSKDVRGDSSPGQKRKAQDDHGKKKFKAKKWKDEQGKQDRRKAFSKQEKENKKTNKYFSKNVKDLQHSTKHGQFQNSKAMKRKLGDGSGSKDFVKKRKTSGPGEQSKGKKSF